MSYFIQPGNDNLSNFLRRHYKKLRSEFFQDIYPFIWHEKPNYMRGENLLYSNKILSKALKLYFGLLDESERKQLCWLPNTHEYSNPFHAEHPQLAPTWKAFIHIFDSDLEQCLFNVAYPGATLSKHYGVSNHCYRLHLCLQESQGFTFRIENEFRKWKEGPENMFYFDDGNLEHEILYEESKNPQPRIVAIFDIKKSFYASVSN